MTAWVASDMPRLSFSRGQLPIYLDYQASTPVDPRVFAVMQPWLTTHYGNPHATHHVYGAAAAEAIAGARAQVAALLHATEAEIIFTSGATEANNMAIQGVARFARSQQSERRHIVTVATEHASVLACCEALTQEGFSLTVLPVGADGLISPEQVAGALREDSLLLSVMAVNNETGVIQPLAQLGDLARRAGVLFHTDAAQAAGRIALDVEAMHIDLLSISGHKIYGPQGVGALYIRRRPRVRIEPLYHGGGQERGLRSGTLPVALVAGMGEAVRLMIEEGAADEMRLLTMRKNFLKRLQELGCEVAVAGSLQHRIAGNLNLLFKGISADELHTSLAGLALSRGASCSAQSSAPSRVLQAMGIGQENLRIGFGRFTTEEEMEHAAIQLATAIGASTAKCN